MFDHDFFTVRLTPFHRYFHTLVPRDQPTSKPVTNPSINPVPKPLRDCRDQQGQGSQEVGERRRRLLHQQQTTNGLHGEVTAVAIPFRNLDSNSDGLISLIFV